MRETANSFPPEAEHFASGKVRELYELDKNRLLIAATDRISVFDVVLPTEIPDKGRLLTGISAFWFARTSEIIPNHLISLSTDGRTMECQRLNMLPIECIVRGYLPYSSRQSGHLSRQLNGHMVQAGVVESARLRNPVLTPSTKARTGHDETIDRAGAIHLVGEELFDEIENVSIKLYSFARSHAADCGFILADTKFEFGIDSNGQLVLADEILTPDSSRFWRAGSYETEKPEESFDKQLVRDWTEATGWDKTYPGPRLPDDIIDATRSKYIETFERLTSISFEDYLANPNIVL